jgi:hypothetical protein
VTLACHGTQMLCEVMMSLWINSPPTLVHVRHVLKIGPTTQGWVDTPSLYTRSRSAEKACLAAQLVWVGHPVRFDVGGVFS